MFGISHHQHWTAALYIVLSYTLNLFLFLLPGFSLAASTATRRRLHAIYLIVIAVATGAVLGYVSFWCFFASKMVGKAFTIFVYTLAFILLAQSLYRSAGARKAARQLATPFSFVLLAGIGYLCLFYMFDDVRDYGAGFADVRFFEQVRPGDNLIPEIFADKIYGHEPLRPFCCGDWLSSDRPPLQSGIFLLLRPLRIGGSASLQYQILSTALQCLWICGAWCVLVALETPERRIHQVLALLALSGFLFYNSVYVWPKLLAASFILLVISIILRVLRLGNANRTDAVLGAFSLGMAILAHPGSIFSLFGLLLLLIAKPRLFRLSQACTAIVILAVLLLPWSAYQRFIDPPGNRLLKMHLAGVFDIDQRSFLETLHDSYRQHSLSEILEFKRQNLLTLFGSKPADSFGLTAIQRGNGLHLNYSEIERSRIVQREYIWNAVGWLNLGWAAIIIFLATGRRVFRPVIPHAGWLIIISAVNLLLWCLTYFGPGGTFTTHSSYADILLLDLGLAGWLLTLPAALLLIILGLQVFNFFAVWAWYAPHTFFPGGGTVQLSFLILGLLCALGFALIFTWNSLKLRENG